MRPILIASAVMLAIIGLVVAMLFMRSGDSAKSETTCFDNVTNAVTFAHGDCPQGTHP
jgi:hypothetical protein